MDKTTTPYSFWEKVYINGIEVESSPSSSERIETHYQILAVYKDIAVIRETNYTSRAEVPLDYWYSLWAIYEGQWNYTSKYYIYVKGVRYDLTGVTNIMSKQLLFYEESPAPDASQVDYALDFTVEDITGYHLDRIFISDSFDGRSVLVAFDEYEYRNGAGLIHTLNYEAIWYNSLDDGFQEKDFLYYEIIEMYRTRVGRQLLLFGEDGTFQKKLDDPIGLDKIIGSIGILN